jgi:hypothetical protein
MISVIKSIDSWYVRVRVCVFVCGGVIVCLGVCGGVYAGFPWFPMDLRGVFPRDLSGVLRWVVIVCVVLLILYILPVFVVCMCIGYFAVSVCVCVFYGNTGIAGSHRYRPEDGGEGVFPPGLAGQERRDGRESRRLGWTSDVCYNKTKQHPHVNVKDRCKFSSSYVKSCYYTGASTRIPVTLRTDWTTRFTPHRHAHRREQYTITRLSLLLTVPLPGRPVSPARRRFH